MLLHAIDENAVPPLVHHVRKGPAKLRPGQALRGSSELHAWGDSNLYLRRRGDTLRLAVEHRAAPGLDDLFLRLPAPGQPLALAIIEEPAQEPAAHQTATGTADERLYAALSKASAPLPLAELRNACRIRTATLCAILNALTAEGTIRKTAAGYTIIC